MMVGCEVGKVQIRLLRKCYTLGVLQPLLIHTDQPPVACNDQLINSSASKWDVLL